jgi:WD40 repeat protein
VSGFTSVVFSPDGKRLAASSHPSSGRSVSEWDAVTGREISGSDDFHDVNRIAFSPDGSLIARALCNRDKENFVNVYLAADGRWVRPQILPSRRGDRDRVYDVAFSPDGGRLASAHSDGIVRISDAVTGFETLVLEGHTDEVRAVAFSPDGQQLISAGCDGTVRVWDARRLHMESER